ncbi:thioesterase domain-containing protein [Gordonia sp. (in: high G+C Gram-positive bacteria)]|uniref:thioesterase domain-containing protein n=1 Tax=Gordonia sp. (in: high G+C Gram-positive bacteria) TaxID=84139 RepID=UPI0039E661EE
MTREVATGTGTSTVIVGYVVPAGDGIDRSQLRDALSRRLPPYMVPTAIEVLDALPMTRNGKLDRRRLPAPTLGDGPQAAPRSPHEAVLEPLFARALGRTHVSVTDSFFDLGGTSLTASVLARRCADALGTAVTVADLFAAPSVSALADRIGGGASADPFGRLLTLRPAPVPADGSPDADSAGPVFAIHPAGGLGWCYAGLLPELDPGTGLYALQADGLDGSPLPQTLREVARDYLDTIEEVAPTGPIQLLGWSVGGVIAHEIAVAAAARGRLVSRLVLLDAYPSECWDGRPAATPAEVRRALLIMAGADSDSELRTDDDVLAALQEQGAALGGLSVEQVRRVAEVVGHFAVLMRSHRTGVVDVDARHVAAARSAEDFLPPRAWEPHVHGALTYTELPVTHPGMVSPESLAAVAAILNGPVSAGPRGSGDTAEPESGGRAAEATAALRARIVEHAPGRDAAAVIDALAAHGTPLVTVDPADPTARRVLLAHVAHEGAAGVYVWVNRITDDPDGPDGLLRRWGATNLWFTEFSVPNGTMASYRFYAYDADDPAVHDGRLEYSRAVADAAVDDPADHRAPDSPFGSVLRTPGAPDLRRWRRGAAARPGPRTVESGHLADGTRWRLTEPIGDGDAEPRIVVVPDAQKWFDRCDLPGVLAAAGSGTAGSGSADSGSGDPGAPVAILGVDAPGDGPSRRRQLGADRAFLASIADDALPRARTVLGATEARAVWAGQSLGGLSALAAAAWFPDAVDELIVYSPSLWFSPDGPARPADWDGGRPWIADLLADAAPRPTRLAVGRNERLLAAPVTGLARELAEAGWPVTLTTYAGGHDLPWWAHLLAADLRTR